MIDRTARDDLSSVLLPSQVAKSDEIARGNQAEDHGRTVPVDFGVCGDLLHFGVGDQAIVVDFGIGRLGEILGHFGGGGIDHCFYSKAGT